MKLLRWTKKYEYSVPITQDEWVTPEETLIDSASGHSDMEMPIPSSVFHLAVTAAAILSSALLLFDFHISVAQSDYFSALSLKNRTVNFSVPPPRGAITDRNGQPLVINVPSFDLLVVTRELNRDTAVRNEHFKRVAEILGRPMDDFIAAVTDNAKKLSVFFVATNLSKDQVLAIRQADISGFSVITGMRRQYIDGSQFSHVIGYVGKVSKEDLTADDYYLPSDNIGRLGVEAAYENELRGTHGMIIFTSKDQKSISQEPKIGHTVALNIDYQLQKKLYNEVFNVLRGTTLAGAAAVIQNPQNGQVLAMVSFPDFDNNIFTDQVTSDEFKRLFQSRSKPLFNRVISGLYNPGSTIKPFIGMAALQEKVISPSDVIRDCVSLSVPNPFDPSHPYVFNNWRSDYGLFNLRRAIADSCNIFFFTIGGGFGNIAGLGIQKIASFLHNAWADQKLGIDLPGENKGFIPTPSWKKTTRGEPWYQGDTYNVSIGQGDLLVTPLWLNAYVSAIANGGTIYRPQIAARIQDQNGITLKEFTPDKIGALPFDKQVIDEVRDDMRETVLSGTAKILQDVPMAVGAKTGTAEVIKGQRINALFTVFAPLNNAQISITVLVEGSSSNQGYAIRIANEVLKWYFQR